MAESSGASESARRGFTHRLSVSGSRLESGRSYRPLPALAPLAPGLQAWPEEPSPASQSIRHVRVFGELPPAPRHSRPASAVSRLCNAGGELANARAPVRCIFLLLASCGAGDHRHGVRHPAILAQLRHVVEEGEESVVVTLRDRDRICGRGNARIRASDPAMPCRASARGRPHIRPRYSSSMMPPSELMTWLRPKPVAIRWSSVGFGSRSPASCSVRNRSYGMLALKLSITQSRQRHMDRAESLLNPCVSA